MFIAKVIVTLLISVVLSFSNGATTTTSFLTVADQNRLQQVFISAIDGKDLSSTHYAVLGFKLLGVPVPNAQVGKNIIFVKCYLFYCFSICKNI